MVVLDVQPLKMIPFGDVLAGTRAGSATHFESRAIDRFCMTGPELRVDILGYGRDRFIDFGHILASRYRSGLTLAFPPSGNFFNIGQGWFRTRPFACK